MFGLTDVVVRIGHTTALDGVTLAVPSGQVTAVVGGDGAGKTTLMRVLVGELAPVSGAVTAPGPAEIGYMPASTGSWRSLSVQENVDFVGGSYGLRGQALAERATTLLTRAGLYQFRDRLSGQLSGGMRRKLAFVLAILHEPALLVLDEPSTGVDPVSRVDLWRMTSQAAAAGTAVLMSTTYLDEAERASSILVLDRGRALLAGTAGQVMSSLSGQLVATEKPRNPKMAWRRGRVFHEWWPDGVVPESAGPESAVPESAVPESAGTDDAGSNGAGSYTGRPIRPDLEDVVIANTLRSTGGS